MLEIYAMTLIAAVRVNNRPSLFGDLRITEGDGTYSSGRKLVRVAPNFVVAWTDQFLAADMVVKALQSRLGAEIVTIASVTQVLTDPSIASDLASLSVTLIGWVVDETGEHCFRWNSAYPGEIFPGFPMYDGSRDAEVVAEGLMRQGDIRATRPYGTEDEQVVRNALYFATRLMAPELTRALLRAPDFGHAYEMLRLAENRRFEYIDNLLYFSVLYEFNSAGRYVSHRVVGSYVKYEVQDEFAIVSIRKADKKETSVDPIRPIGHYSAHRLEQLKCEIATRRPSALFDVEFYCMFMLFKAPCFRPPWFLSPPMVQTLPKSHPSLRDFIRLSNGQLRVAPKRRHVEQMFRAIREDVGYSLPAS